MYLRTVWRQVFRSVWKDFKTRFQHILDGLRNHRELIESQANLLHFQQYQRDSLVVLDHIRQYQGDRKKMLDKLLAWEQEERHNKYIAVMEWVAGAQTKLDHDSACDARSGDPRSGRWILKKPEVENWREADTPILSILWLKGNPGAGMWTSPTKDQFPHARSPKQVRRYLPRSSSKSAWRTSLSPLFSSTANMMTQRRTTVLQY
jgi:hypothetical protein